MRKKALRNNLILIVNLMLIILLSPVAYAASIDELSGSIQAWLSGSNGKKWDRHILSGDAGEREIKILAVK